MATPAATDRNARAPERGRDDRAGSRDDGFSSTPGLASGAGPGASLSGSLALVIGAGCLIALLTFGVRSSFGLFTGPLSAGRGWSREVFSVSMALQNLMWGVGQPLIGAAADRFGPARALAASALLYALGVVLVPLSTTPLALHLTAGLMVGLGMGGASFYAVVAAFGRLVPEDRRSWAMGIGTAAGSLGQFLIVPLAQAFVTAYGWQTALTAMGGLVALVPLLAVPLRGGRPEPAQVAPEASFGATLWAAFRHPSYLLLVTGFFACGFQLAFLQVHLPAFLTDVGISPTLAAWALALIGLFNIMGAYGAGVLGSGGNKKAWLSLIYLGRAGATAGFMLAPIAPETVVAYACVMGVLWLSTVPLTSGLVAVMFGTRYLATLVGFVFLSHQVGSFLGVWLGGRLFEQTGSYAVAWWLTVLIALASALIHVPILERAAPRAAIPPAY